VNPNRIYCRTNPKKIQHSRFSKSKKPGLNYITGNFKIDYHKKCFWCFSADEVTGPRISICKIGINKEIRRYFIMALAILKPVGLGGLWPSQRATNNPRFGMALPTGQRDQFVATNQDRAVKACFDNGLQTKIPETAFSSAEDILSLGYNHNRDYLSKAVDLGNKVLANESVNAGTISPKAVLDFIVRGINLGTSHGRDYSAYTGVLSQVLEKVIPTANEEEMRDFFNTVKQDDCPFVPNTEVHNKTLDRFAQLNMDVPL
jgi:hypothetical protein